MRGVLLLAATCLVVTVSSAEAARVVGRIRLTEHEPLQASVDPYPAQLGSMPVHAVPATSVQHVAIVLTAQRSLPPAPGHRTLQMAQQGQTFEPRVLAIEVGTVVDFPNFDPIFHNVFSYSKTKKFDLGRYGRGSSKSVTFDKPGIVKVFCDIHSNMSGFIYVAASPWVTQPGADGRFTFENVAAGSYELTVWHPERGEVTRSVVIGETDMTLDVEL